MYKYLIVGNSVAAISAAENIRKIDPKGSLAMVFEENFPAPYPRPLITYALAGKVDWTKITYKSKEFYRRHNIETFPGKKVVKIDPEAKKAFLENGKEINYHKLLLATGSRPVIPPIKGIDKKGVYTFTTLNDAHEINSRLRFAKQALVIGGGLIGLKGAEALISLGIKTTIVELLERLLAPVLDIYGAQLVKEVFEEQGATVLTGISVTEILPRSGNKASVGGVRLSNGKEIPAEIVIVATGVAPRKELAEKAGIKTNKGILVNERMETSAKDIYAAGDVAEGYDIIVKNYRPLLIWPNAFLQGKVAGLNMAGKNERYEGGVAMNSTNFFGYPIASAGLTNPENEKEFEILYFKKPKEKIYRRLILKDNKLLGFITAGKVSPNGLLVNLIKKQTNIKSIKRNLLNINFSLIDFPKKYRQSLLAAKEVR